MAITLEELKTKVCEYQYMEDTDIIDICIASVIATRLKLGDPVWLVIIGASSGGKSQLLRPISITDKDFIHRIDDITENTFLSGSQSKEGELSLLSRIGSQGIIVLSDLTVLFSKNSESRSAILSQFRMLYDGEMTKIVGNQKTPLHWEGYLGVIGASTPTIYSHFEEVSDMGERFIYYRMKETNPVKATKLALNRKLFGKSLDKELSLYYEEYIKDVVMNANVSNIVISEEVENRIIGISILAEKIRTTSHLDFRSQEISRIITPALPMRVALQLFTLAKSLQIMRGRDLDEKDMAIIDWVGYSLANEEKRACLRVLVALDFGENLSTQKIADNIGLNTNVIGIVLQNLSAVGVLKRTGSSGSLFWEIADINDYNIIKRIEQSIEVDKTERSLSDEEDAYVVADINDF
jgi:hypothetical protein